jgi:hypothetical protein
MTAVRRAGESEVEDARRKHAVELAALKDKWETEQAVYRTHVQVSPSPGPRSRIIRREWTVGPLLARLRRTAACLT